MKIKARRRRRREKLFIETHSERPEMQPLWCKIFYCMRKYKTKNTIYFARTTETCGIHGRNSKTEWKVFFFFEKNQFTRESIHTILLCMYPEMKITTQVSEWAGSSNNKKWIIMENKIAERAKWESEKNYLTLKLNFLAVIGRSKNLYTSKATTALSLIAKMYTLIQQATR